MLNIMRSYVLKDGKKEYNGQWLFSVERIDRMNKSLEKKE